MPRGSDVVAARGGTVVGVREDSARLGSGWNNYVRVEHEDGTVAHYVHLDTDGALVEPGEGVERGQVIARSGWTGRAMIPHLHFHVTRAFDVLFKIDARVSKSRLRFGLRLLQSGF